MRIPTNTFHMSFLQKRLGGPICKDDLEQSKYTFSMKSWCITGTKNSILHMFVNPSCRTGHLSTRQKKVGSYSLYKCTYGPSSVKHSGYEETSTLKPSSDKHSYGVTKKPQH
uniref:Uncharacterized protein n=1 Tax=Cacopsylla melanoneura TaxID=428564 RepID=A0A8D8X6R3_9HEMI